MHSATCVQTQNYCIFLMLKSKQMKVFCQRGLDGRAKIVVKATAGRWFDTVAVDTECEDEMQFDNLIPSNEIT